jgi:hypothetical protein
MLYSKRNVIFIFFAFSILLIGLSYLIANSYLINSNPEVIYAGITFDITISIPLVYYLIARRKRLPKMLIIPLFLTTLLAASFIIPRNYQQFLDLIKFIVFPIELLLMFIIIFKTKKIIKEFNRVKLKKAPHFSLILRDSLVKIIKNKKLSEVLTSEISLIYFGLIAWRTVRPDYNFNFTSYKKIGYGSVIGVIAFLSFLETIVLHLILLKLSSLFAWVIFGLNLYGIVFLFADLNATRRQPLYITKKKVYISAGIRWRSIIPIKDIKSVELKHKEFRNEKQLLRALTLLGMPNLIICLKRIHEAEGLYGIRKKFNKIVLNLDEPETFKQIIDDKIANN